MTPYEYLAEVRRCARRIGPLSRELSMLHECGEAGTSWESHGPGVGHGSGTASDPTATMAESIIERLPRRIAEVRGELEECERTVGDCLEMLGLMSEELGARHALALEIYWVDGAATWSEVAAEMGIPPSTARWLRDRGYEWMEARHVC